MIYLNEYYLKLTIKNENYLITLIPPTNSKVKYIEIFNQIVEILYSDGEFIPLKIENKSILINEFMYNNKLIKVDEKANRDKDLLFFLYPKKELTFSLQENISIFNDRLKTKLLFKSTIVENYIIYEKFYENGIREIKYTIDKETEWKVGDCFEYYENSNLLRKCFFKDGNKEKVLKEYFENGNLHNMLEYKNGNINGKCIKYYESGNLEIFGNYENDKLNGEYIEYYDIKNCKRAISNYINDLKEKSIFYNEDGTIYTIENYNEDGTAIIQKYNKDGTITIIKI